MALTNQEAIIGSIDSIESKKSFLYIGTSLNKTKKCMLLYKESFMTKDLKEAKDLLDKDLEIQENLPSLIILDIPYHKQSHSEFMVWLNDCFKTSIPVIYNETAIRPGEIKELKQLRLIDDVVKIENYCNRLHEKAKFLKKTNAYLNQPVITEKFHNELDNYKLERPSGYAIKRSIDIVISLLAILFFMPLFLVIAIAIKWESGWKGNVIYSSFRAGRGFKIFKFYKFRTMIPDADKKLSELADLNIYDNNENETTAFFKVINDPRITKIGSFLRNSSLDELPQLFNVLKGDMSIVGNRPLPLYEAASLTTDEWAERFMAPAGITGLWQVSKRGNKNMCTEERIALDIDYARHQSLKGDLLIMLRTPTALIQKSNV